MKKTQHVVFIALAACGHRDGEAAHRTTNREPVGRRTAELEPLLEARCAPNKLFRHEGSIEYKVTERLECTPNRWWFELDRDGVVAGFGIEDPSMFDAVEPALPADVRV